LESQSDRAKEELAETQRQLQEEKEIAQGRIQQLESELSRKSGAGEQAVSDRARIEERAALVQKALEVMEQQLREERESFAKQSQQFEAELNQARAKCTQLETRVSTLIGELDKSKGRSRKKGAAAVESESDESATLTTRSAGRILALESELATGSSQLPADKQTAKTRISRLETRWEELKSRLLPKDKELTELRQREDEFRARIEELEAALEEAGRESEDVAEEAAAQPKAEEGSVLLSRDRVQTLYNQSMGKLTVLMASADIVLMNPKLDPKAKGSVEDIKTEGQALLELIKSYTLPPDPKKTE
jgi:chromosome segregation ATPase